MAFTGEKVGDLRKRLRITQPDISIPHRHDVGKRQSRDLRWWILFYSVNRIYLVGSVGPGCKPFLYFILRFRIEIVCLGLAHADEHILLRLKHWRPEPFQVS